MIGWKSARLKATKYQRAQRCVCFYSLWMLLIFSVQSAVACESPAFGNLVKRGQSYAADRNWDAAISCYKKAAKVASELSGGYFFMCVREALEKAPLSPDAHIAMGLAYQIGLDPKRIGTCGKPAFLSDCGQSELEYRQAETLSSRDKKQEASRLLENYAVLKARAVAFNKQHWEQSDYDDLYENLLGFRWQPLKRDSFYLTRVIVEDVNWSGRMRARVEVSSSCPEHDASAVMVCQSAIDDFPNFNWWGERFQFASNNSRKWVEHTGSGSIGMPALMAFHTRESVGNCQSAAANYVRQRWTAKRVLDYCREETRLPKCMQNEALSVGGNKWIMGAEYSQCAGEIAGVQWWSGVERGIPISYAVRAKSPGNFWMLESGLPISNFDNDDEFLRHRLCDSLFFAIRFYELAHAAELQSETWSVRRKSNPANERLIRDGGAVKAYECILENGQTVTANINDVGTISSVFVNGKFDSTWTQSIEEGNRNFQILDSYPESGIKPIREVALDTEASLNRMLK